MIDRSKFRLMPLVEKPDANQSYILSQMIAWATARRALMNSEWPACCYVHDAQLDIYRMTCLDRWGIWLCEVRAKHEGELDLAGRAYTWLLPMLKLIKTPVITEGWRGESVSIDSLKLNLASIADDVLLKHKNSEQYQRVRRRGCDEFLNSQEWNDAIQPLFSIELAPQRGLAGRAIEQGQDELKQRSLL